MPRSPFGWSLPPGVTQRMIDEAYGYTDDDDPDDGEPGEPDYNFPYAVNLWSAGWFVRYDQNPVTWSSWLVPNTGDL